MYFLFLSLPSQQQTPYVAPQPITAPIAGAPVEETPPGMGAPGQMYNPYAQQQQPPQQVPEAYANQAYTPAVSASQAAAPPQAQGDASAQVIE